MDVRLLSGADAPRRKLRGVALGTIAPLSPSELRALELDLKVHKLLSDKTERPNDADAKALKDKEDIDALLSFGRVSGSAPPALAQAMSALPTLPATKKTGRPKGAKDRKPRKPTGVVKGAARESKQAKLAAEGVIDTLMPEIVPLEEKQ